jgi:LysR family transcriptional regulator for metE and metH
MSPDLSMTRLRIFATVVEQSGYSAAARSIGVSQATVSFHMRALEQSFGTGLLLYRGRRVVPTPAGEALYGLARRTLRDVEELTAQIAGLRAGRAGRVRLGASMAFEQDFFFTTIVAPYVREHPDVELSLRFGTSHRVVEDVRAREADIAYVMRWRTPSDVRYTPLHPSRVVFFVADDHPLTAERWASADTISAAGLITAPLDTVEYDHYGHVLDAAGLHGYRVALEVTGIQARILAARAGLGVLVAFWPPFARQVELPGLTRLRVTEADPPGPEFGVVQRLDEPVSPSVGAFTAWLRHTAR